MIKFHDVKTTDRELVQSYTLCSDRQNCDLALQISSHGGSYTIPK